MAWKISFEPAAIKDLERLDSQTRSRILQLISDRLEKLENPRQLGEALSSKKYQGIWKYRVGDYRILVEIKDTVLTVLVVEIGHRR